MTNRRRSVKPASSVIGGAERLPGHADLGLDVIDLRPNSPNPRNYYLRAVIVACPNQKSRKKTESGRDGERKNGEVIDLYCAEPSPKNDHEK